MALIVPLYSDSFADAGGAAGTLVPSVSGARYLVFRGER